MLEVFAEKTFDRLGLEDKQDFSIKGLNSTPCVVLTETLELSIDFFEDFDDSSVSNIKLYRK
jgi:hypothetical protein